MAKSLSSSKDALYYPYHIHKNHDTTRQQEHYKLFLVLLLGTYVETSSGKKSFPYVLMCIVFQVVGQKNSLWSHRRKLRHEE